ncbi:hypothetical protein ACTFIV_004714 [Dictyostelium citrinum]
MTVEVSLDVNSLQILDEASSKRTYKPNTQSPRKIILFDGICNVCDGFIQFVHPRDTNNLFSFQALQSEKGREILQYYGIKCDVSTVVLVDESINRVYVKSSAILTVCYYLNAPFSYLYSFTYVPTFVRDVCYDIFGKYRYLIMGKKDSCMFSITLRDKFIDFKSPLIFDEEQSEEKEL